MINNQVTSHKKKILVVSPVPSHPQNSGNRIRIFNMLKILQSLGYFIEFLYVDRERNSKHVVKKVNTSEMMNEWNSFLYFSVASNKNLSYFRKYQFRFQSFLTYLIEKADEQIGELGWKLYKISPSLYKQIRKLFLGNKQSLLSPQSLINPNYTPIPPTIKYDQSRDDKNNLGRVNHSGRLREYYLDEWYPQKLDNFLSQLTSKKQYHAVICEYVYLSKSLLHFNNRTIKIIDTHDCFANRNDRLAKYNLRNPFFSTTPDEEGRGLNRADVVIAIQDEERQIFEKECKQPVATVGHSVKIISNPTISPVGKNILYVGSGNEGNRQAVDFFVTEIWPHIIKKDTQVQFTLAGAICKFHDKIPNCKLLGEVNSLEDIYQNSDVVINPAIIGTGLKIKTIEALGYGKPMVCTSHAAIGIDIEKSGLVIADEPEDIVTKIIDLLNNFEERKKLSNKGLNYARGYNKNIIRSLELIFDK